MKGGTHTKTVYPPFFVTVFRHKKSPDLWSAPWLAKLQFRSVGDSCKLKKGNSETIQMSETRELVGEIIGTLSLVPYLMFIFPSTNYIRTTVQRSACANP